MLFYFYVTDSDTVGGSLQRQEEKILNAKKSYKITVVRTTIDCQTCRPSFTYFLLNDHRQCVELLLLTDTVDRWDEELACWWWLQALDELRSFMIVDGVALKEKQKLMRNLRVSLTLSVCCTSVIHHVASRLDDYLARVSQHFKASSASDLNVMTSPALQPIMIGFNCLSNALCHIEQT